MPNTNGPIARNEHFLAGKRDERGGNLNTSITREERMMSQDRVTPEEINSMISDALVSYYDMNHVDTALNGKAAASHSHAQADVTGLADSLAGKAAASHAHDDRYYTETETDTLLAGKSDKTTLSGAEISTVARESLAGEKNGSFANRMLITYIALTFVTLFSLKLTGMGWFDATTNAMSACSTCGFCTRNTSIAFYANPAAETVLTVAMLAAGVHFGILFLAFIKGSPRFIWKSETIKVFLSLVGIAIVIVTTDLMLRGHYSSFAQALRDASFQVASISTTTGFATQDTTLWPPLSMSVLIICSLICGCSGSTSGGIKVDRAILAAKGIYRKVKLTVEPNGIYFVRVDGRARSEEQISDAYGYIFCYLILMVVFAAVNIAFGEDFTTGVTASIACIGNVGPGFGDVGSMSNYSDFPAILKFTGMIEMLIGRLEIFPVLYLFRSIKKS